MNGAITYLGQIRWRFNGAKNPVDFKKNMLDAIDKLPLTDELAKKFIGEGATVGILRNRIKNNFEDIFKLVD